ATQAAMPNQPAPENRRIRYLEKLIESGRTQTLDNPRDLLPQKFKKELAEKQLQRDQGIANRRHTTAESNRVISSLGGIVEAASATNAEEIRRGNATVVAHVDRGFSEVKDVLTQVVGTPGSSKHWEQQEVYARNEKKRAAKEERQASRAAEKRRKLEEPYRVERQEGDVEVAGVVLRGEGIAWAQHHQVDAELEINGVRCRLVLLGTPSLVQLVGIGQEQLKKLADAATVFALNKGAEKFVRARIVSDGKRPAKLLDEDEHLAKGTELLVHGMACSVLAPGLVKVHDVPEMIKFLRDKAPFPELKVVDAGGLHGCLPADCRDRVPMHAKKLLAVRPQECSGVNL
ncbi:unnamed protein product, partial [Symbiodinium sp. CCMP2592]